MAGAMHHQGHQERHGGMNPSHHRKSNSGSVNSHAVMSGKQQMGGGSGIGNMKFVKPSELSLDLINPSNLRNMGIKGAHSGSMHNQTTLAGGAPQTSTNNQNM